ncbi:MAG: methionine--tRNA ligase [Methanosarcinaceae archaeon]|nr:methionine--tRNA ligase [Methanosarcinaceae archaeon]
MKLKNYEKPAVVTCGLPYANGKAHIGHMRTYIPADIYVRAMRKAGREILFICGSDTHGTPVVVNAEKEGVTPKELVTVYHEHFKNLFETMEIEFDAYGTTDDPENYNRTKDIINKNIEANHVFKQKTDVAYCTKCNMFLPDRYVEGICAHCGEIARGDECDQGCGRPLGSGELLNPVCAVCKTPAVYKEQEHYYFKLSDFTKRLEKFLENLKGTENAINYSKGWLEQGLKDWCITRNLSWGIPFPGADDLVVYVWVDAPIGYIAFTEQWAKKNNESWEKYWKENNSDIVHFIGGDIVYHHCIFWPAMLMGAGYSTPTDVVASGMLKIENQKFSKSRGNVVWVEEDYLEQGFHPDLLRYYLAGYTSHTKEVNFSWKIFQDKINTELVAVLGNFIYRSMLFVYRNFGKIPNGEIEPEIIEKSNQTFEKSFEALENYEFKKYIDTIMELAAFGNGYFQSNEPWNLIKTDTKKCEHVLLNCMQIVKSLCILFEPVAPGKMEEAWRNLGFDVSLKSVKYDELTVPLSPGTPINKPEILFKKVEDEKIEVVEKIAQARLSEADIKSKPDKSGKDPKNENEIKSIKKTKNEEESMEENEDIKIITIDDFFKTDIRIGKIVSAEPIPKSDKLYKVIVDVGEENPRQIVSGLRDYYTEEELTGKTVCVIVNLKTAKLRGVESQGMVLAAEDEQGNVRLLTPDEVMKPGSKIR